MAVRINSLPIYTRSGTLTTQGRTGRPSAVYLVNPRIREVAPEFSAKSARNTHFRHFWH